MTINVDILFIFSGYYQVDEIPYYKWQAVDHVVCLAACIIHLHPWVFL